MELVIDTPLSLSLIPKHVMLNTQNYLSHTIVKPGHTFIFSKAPTHSAHSGCSQ